MAHRAAAVVLVLFALPCTGLELASQVREQSLEKEWSSDLNGSTKNPVKRVLRLLEKMRAELQHESQSEEKAFDKMMCDCATNEKEKTAAKESAAAEASELASAIESRYAQKGNLATKIDSMKKQIQADTSALKQAVAIREKEAAKFSAEHEDTKQTVANLNNAVKVLSKHQGSSMLQLGSPEFASVQAILQDATQKHDMMLAAAARPRRGRLGAPKRKSYSALLQQGAGALRMFALHDSTNLLPMNIAQHMLARLADRIPATGSFMQGSKGPSSYSSRSDGIFGIVSKMKEEFEADMTQAQKDEAKAADDFDQLSKTKTEQISSGKGRLDGLEQDHADNLMALANAEEDRDLATEKEAANAAFLGKLRQTCKEGEAQFSERSATRTEEIKAIGEALTVLTDDDNREQLAHNKELSLLQRRSVANVAAEVRRSNALAALHKALRLPRLDIEALEDAFTPVTPKARLANLAVSVKLDGFDKIKANMDRMIAELQKEQKEEVKFKAYCQSELNANEKATMSKEDEVDTLGGNANRIARRLDALRTEIAAAKASVAETQAAVKEASETRAQDHQGFQATIADQQATQAILKKALEKLQAFYGKKSSLLEVSQSATKYSKSAGASPVMTLLSHIIENSHKLEKEAIAGDAAGQANQESFVEESNAVISQLSAEISKKTQKAAAAEGELGETHGDQQNAKNEAEALQEYRGDIHQKCDFVLKHFDKRQEGRTSTIEEIQHGKALLSGMQ